MRYNVSMSYPSSNKNASARLLLILANVLWACSYVAAKFALSDMSVTMMNATRMIFSALVLLPFVIINRKSLNLTRRDIPQLALLALIGFIINKILEYGGLSLTTASDVALLIASESIFTAALSWLLLRERFRLLTGIGLVVGLIGVYLIVERSVIPAIPAGGGALRIVGDVLVVFALTFEAFYTVRGKALLVKHPPVLITSVAIVGSTLFWIPAAGADMILHGWHMPGVTAWLGVGWLAIMSTIIAYLFWFKGLMRIDGSAASSTLFIQPLLGTLLAVAILHDQLAMTTIVGGALIIASVYLISRQ